MPPEPPDDEFRARLELQNAIQTWRQDWKMLEREDYGATKAQLAEIVIRREKMSIEGRALDARRKVYEAQYGRTLF